MLTNLIGIIIAYLLGSLSSAIIAAKIFKQEDPRTQGSGNAGATNVLRTQGKKQAIIVLAGDLLKGFLAVIIARILGVQGMMLGLVAFAAVFGHVFPVYFKFKGGKGVATAIGALLGLTFWVAVITILAWLICAAITRYASLSSIIASIVAVICTFIFGAMAYTLPLILIAALIIFKHQENIKRLKNKTESKINF